MILHLHLVRHGQTYFNRYNRLQGWSNSPLTESGVADAVKAGERLKFTIDRVGEDEFNKEILEAYENE